MSGRDLAEELLATARSDLKALAHMGDPDGFDERIFGFHAQQAVEKALKAWINCLQDSHPFTHDLSLLLHTLEALGQEIELYWGFLELNGYAVQFRYEMLSEDDEPLDRSALLNDVELLLARVANIIKQQ